MKTTVALTALESHWGVPEETRFLGEWCKTDARQERWAAYPPEVLSKRWANPEESLRAMDYVVTLGTRLAESVGRRLDDAYKLGMDTRFYRQMLSPWAISFTSTLYDRYLAVKDACAALPAPVFLTGENPDDVVPSHDLLGQMGVLANSDTANLQLFSLIVGFLGLSQEALPCAWTKEDLFIGQRRFHSSNKKRFFRVYYALQKLTKRKFYIISSVYHAVDFKNLLKKTNYRMLFDDIQEWPAVSVSLDGHIRRHPLGMGGDEFTELLAYCAPRYLPWGLAEAMPAYISAAHKHPAARASGFLSCFTPYTNLPAQYIAVLAKAPVGIYAHTPFLHRDLSSDMEQTLADRHFPLPANPFCYPALPKVTPKKHVLLPLSGMYRYVLRLATFAHPLFQEIGTKLYLPFLEALDTRIPVSIRKYVADYGSGSDWLRHCPHIPVHLPKDVPYAQAMAEARVVVSGDCWYSAVPTDALAYNRPTVLIQWTALQRLLPEAEPAIQALKKAGILHNDPEKAAQKINEVYDDAEDWWASAEVQNARRTFLEVFCPSCDDWERKWLRELQSMERKWDVPSREPTAKPTG